MKGFMCLWYNVSMNKFYAYISPISFFVIVSAVAIMILNNEFVIYIGLLISLFWLNRVGAKFNNAILQIVTTVALFVTLLWGMLMLLVAWGWRAG